MAEVCCFIYSLERANDTAVLVSDSGALPCAKPAASGLFTFHELVALLLLVIPGFRYVK